MEKTLPRIFRDTAKKYPQISAQMSRFGDGHFEPTSYEQAWSNIRFFGAGLLSIGVERGEHIGLISDNRKEWLQADMGLLSIGAVDVPRGCDATISDLEYILSFAETKIIIVENKSQIKKIISIKYNHYQTAEIKLSSQKKSPSLDEDFFYKIAYKNYFKILETTPAPTVLPPSRIAKRKPSFIAIG